VRSKQVRRRRAVLAGLVVVSLILLTAYFGRSTSSPLHAVQRGVAEVLSPIESGASKVLSPVKDLAGWVSSTLHAKSRNAQLVKENQRLQDRLAIANQEVVEYRQAAQDQSLDVKLGIGAAQRVNASVIFQDPSLWYQQIEVDAGSDGGVAQNDPVVGDGALVGKVVQVDASVCWVQLITDHSYQVPAEVQEPQGNAVHADRGVLVPQVGNPNQLQMQYVPGHAPVQPGDQVVTTGFVDPSNRSLVDIFPAGIPIGYVSQSFSAGQLLSNGTIPVTPSADLEHLQNVQILVRVNGATQLAAAHIPARGGTG
jgi:rod shape-determining protein MreC